MKQFSMSRNQSLKAVTKRLPPFCTWSPQWDRFLDAQSFFSYFETYWCLDPGKKKRTNKVEDEITGQKKNAMCSHSKEEEINYASAGNFKTLCGNDAARSHVFSEEINSPTSAATFFRASGESGWWGGGGGQISKKFT